MSKKVPHLLDTEDLLKALNENSLIITPESNLEIKFENQANDILSFLSTFNITDGQERIKKVTIYAIYKAWSLSPLNKKAFHTEVSKYIPVDPARNNYYSINQNAIKLTYIAYRDFKKTRDKLKSKFWSQRVSDFLNYYALQNGPFWIEKDILYFLYDKFEHDHKRNTPSKQLTKKYFEKLMDVYLKFKITEKGKVYSISENVKNLFQNGQLERMQKANAKKKKSKKRNKKKQTKIPRTRPKI